MTDLRTLRRRLLAPEVVQTSEMDCGPASLKCMLEGFGISASYGRLREACHTYVDGASIDTLEEVAVQLGLDAVQIMLPFDHLLLVETHALPAIVVVRLPNGFTHFVVVWRAAAGFVQIMDPATGRRWTTAANFLATLYEHALPVPAAAWREWAGSAEFLSPLRRRLADLCISRTHITHLIHIALADTSWRSLAALDAATRQATALVQAGGIRRGREATRLLDVIMTQLDTLSAVDAIPAAYWSVHPGPSADDGEEQVILHGAVLVRVRGRQALTPETASGQSLSPELDAALAEAPAHPAKEVLRLMGADGLRAVVWLGPAVLLSAGAIVVEAVLLRRLIDIGQIFGQASERIIVVAMIFLFALGLLLLRYAVSALTFRLGRQLELRLRSAIYQKIPRLRDPYLRSRPISDMAQRSHMVQRLRQLPHMAVNLVQVGFALFFTTIGIIWLSPVNQFAAPLAALAVLAWPVLMLPWLGERDLRMRTHVGALSRYYLDALAGMIAVRAHSAERSIRYEHRGLLAEWTQSVGSLYGTMVFVEGGQLLLGFGFALWLLFRHWQFGSGGDIALLVYWLLSLPLLAQEFALTLRQYPSLRSTLLRLLEPLGAAEEDMTDPEHGLGHRGPEVSMQRRPSGAKAHGQDPNIHSDGQPVPAGVHISWEGVSVVAAGHPILTDITYTIHPGEHIAIVGPSGAGKSSMMGALLGWHRPAAGRLFVDGLPLTGARLAELRRATAWVDPGVYLWNRSVQENVVYGADERPQRSLAQIIDQAELVSLLHKLPDGVETIVGEGGALLSGGEGQRVRLARAMLPVDVRLVILDEPFRGLERKARQTLLQRARVLWPAATLLCITHDIGETQAFSRVLVMEDGRLVEDGAPADLWTQPDSRYRTMLDAEAAIRMDLWGGNRWRRLRMENGVLTETPAAFGDTFAGEWNDEQYEHYP